MYKNEGVKLNFLVVFAVAPFAGAWIEIYDSIEGVKSRIGRSLRGSED